MPWRRSRLLQKYAKAADHAKSAIGTGSPCGPAAPCRAAASRFHIPVFHATFVPHAIPRPLHTWAASPYGIAVSPYSHTPDVFPHISQQIHIAGPSPHTIHKLQKSGFHFDETSGSSSTNPNQPRQADIQNLRYNPANQKPTSSSKCYRPATGGHRHLLHVRPWSRAHIHWRAHGHGHARTVTHMHGHGHARMVTHMHGHSHTFTGMCTATSTSGHAFDETSVRLAQIKRQPSSLKCPAAA